MKELLMILASAMTMPELAKRIKEAIEEYENDPNEITFGGVSVMCQVWLSKQIIDHTNKKAGREEGHVSGITDALKEFDTLDRANKLLKTTDQ